MIRHLQIVGMAGVALLAVLLFSTRAQSQQPAAPGNLSGGRRIVVEVTTGDATQWPHALDMVDNLLKTFGPDHTQIEVVCHMPGLKMLLLKNGNALGGTMSKQAASGVTFAACENSMRKMHVDKSELYPLAKTVDSGAAEVVRKEEAGWSYLKFGI